jgi:hypothetical protein
MPSEQSIYPDSSLNPDRLKSTFETISTQQYSTPIGHEEFAINTSREVVPLTKKLFGPDSAINLEELDEKSNISQRHLLQIRKISEIYEDQWKLRLPSEPLYKAARTLGKVTTIGGILIALKGVHETATPIKSTYEARGRAAIEDSQIEDFYFASAVLFGELVLMATPISTRFAFQATGRLHSYLLWRRFHNHRAVYRLLLHHLYYTIKGFPSLALHEAQSISQRVDRFVDSVVFIIRTTWVSFDEPAFLADLTSVELSGGFFDSLTDLDLGDLQEQIGDGYEELRNYIESVLGTLESHYEALYDYHLDTRPSEIVTRIIKQLLSDL